MFCPSTVKQPYNSVFHLNVDSYPHRLCVYPPTQDASHKGRFSSGFPTKNVIILVVTVTAWGVVPTYTLNFAKCASWAKTMFDLVIFFCNTSSKTANH